MNYHYLFLLLDKSMLSHHDNLYNKRKYQVKAGVHLGDVSNAIEEYATSHKLGVVRELEGHGIGSNLHEDPGVPNYGKKGTGIILKENMTIAVEPMLTSGTRKIYLLVYD